MLTNCNTLSVSRLKSAGAEFKKHTQLLTEIKKDLETIFKRIRILRGKLEKEYPEAYHGECFNCEGMTYELSSQLSERNMLWWYLFKVYFMKMMHKVP